MCHLTGENVMSIIAWLILGLIAGFIASRIVNKTGEGLFLDIVLGIVDSARRCHGSARGARRAIASARTTE